MMEKQSNATKKALVWCTLALCGSGCAGCRQAPQAIAGRVTLAGEPLDDAAILFVPTQTGRKKTGAPIVDGKYMLPADVGLLPGTYRVEIVDNPPLDDPGAHRPQVASAAGDSPRRRVPYVYAHDSPLGIEVSAHGPATFDFELKGQP
jgi:hypothetical protein